MEEKGKGYQEERRRVRERKNREIASQGESKRGRKRKDKKGGIERWEGKIREMGRGKGK